MGADEELRGYLALAIAVTSGQPLSAAEALRLAARGADTEGGAAAYAELNTNLEKGDG